MSLTLWILLPCIHYCKQTIDEAEYITTKNALFAPIGASASLLFVYVLLKFDIDPTTLYALLVTALGALSISDIGVPILRNILPKRFAEAEIALPNSIAEKLDLDEPTLPVDGVTTLVLGIICSIAYWGPAAMAQKFVVSNVIAWSLAMVSLGAISLGSYQTASILLAGLFCYDIFWVFGTDVMVRLFLFVECFHELFLPVHFNTYVYF